MPKPKPLQLFHLKISDDQRRFLEMTAKAQGHYNMSEVLKRLLNREMGATLVSK